MSKTAYHSADESIIDINNRIENMNYVISKLQFIKSVFPDVKIQTYKSSDGKDWFQFSSKMVSTNYTNYDIENAYRAINVNLYSELEFVYNGKSEIVKIFSDPKKIKLAKASTYRRNGEYGRYIIFYKFSFSKHVSPLKDEALSKCRNAIMMFIKQHTDYKLDTKNLDARLKKLLIFT
jgi:hypothetical protein